VTVSEPADKRTRERLTPAMGLTRGTLVQTGQQHDLQHKRAMKGVTIRGGIRSNVHP